MDINTIDKAPEEVLRIIKELNDHNYEAFTVGGCVRDSVLGRIPYDWDITTNALPGQVKDVFTKTIDTGIKHGTVTVVSGSSSIEVTTYRIDGMYIDNRHPEKVEFTASLIEDLSRRDFTINAVAWHPELGFCDPFNGMEDVKIGIIRTVGNAGHRFREDALRMMRAIRFSAQLGFRISDETLNAIFNNSHLIKNISAERVRDELTKILTSPNTGAFNVLQETGLLQHIMPEFAACYKTEQNHPYHIYNVALHSLKAVSSVQAVPLLRWTMLLHDIGKVITKTTDAKGVDHFYGHPDKSVEIARTVLRRLKFDNGTIEKVCRLVKYHDRKIEPVEISIRKLLHKIGEDIFLPLLEVQAADKKAQNPDFLGNRLEVLKKVKEIYSEIKRKGQCFRIEDLSIKGQDLIALGMKPGKNIGMLLEELLQAVLEKPEHNTREKLLELFFEKVKTIR